MLSKQVSSRRSSVFVLCMSALLLLSFSWDWVFAEDDCLADKDQDGKFICGSAGGKCPKQNGTCRFRKRKFPLPQVCSCFCSDPQIEATLIAKTPIPPFPATVVFEPTGNWIVKEVSGGPITATPQGSVRVRFELDTSSSLPFISATIEDMLLQASIFPAQIGAASLLPINASVLPFGPFIVTTNSATGENVILPTSSSFTIDPDTGLTFGAVGLLASTPLGFFSLKGDVEGTFNFQTGQWSLTIASDSCPIEVGPDQLHVVGPIPNRVPVGQGRSITATVEDNFIGMPLQKVLFIKQLGKITFSSGIVSPNGSQTTVFTNDRGSATVDFVVEATGPVLIKVVVIGTNLSAFSFFSAIP